MAKKREGQRKIKIDHLGLRVQQTRSPPRKRRTDFSTFFSYDSCHNKVSSLECSSSEDGLSNITVTNLDGRKDMGKPVSKSFVPHCSNADGDEEGSFTNFSKASIIDIGSTVEDIFGGLNYDGVPYERKVCAPQKLKLTPDKSHIIDCDNVLSTPGSIVWAKADGGMWWPAEVMGESTLSNSSDGGADGLILVQFYGDNRSSWVDPVRDLSNFDLCFEERSCNPTEQFQVALNQALVRKEQMNSCAPVSGSPNGHNNSSWPDLASDKWNSLSPSRTEEHSLGNGRSKRKRTPKIRFDEIALKPKSSRKLRRYKIMRFLGLLPPIGSPF